MRKTITVLLLAFALTAFQQAISQSQISIALQSGSTDSICNNFASVSFVATTNCTSPIYQWYINNSPIPNKNDAQLSYNGFSDGDVITCKQTNNTAPCGEATSNGITIHIKPDQALSWINSSGSVNQTMCQYTAITPIKFQVIGATGATVNGLPTGVTGSYNNGEFTISGTPTQNGTFNYQVTTSGNNLCGSSAQTSGTLSITQAPELNFIDAIRFTFNNCSNSTGKPDYILKIANQTNNSSSISSYSVNWGDGYSQNVSNGSFPLSHTYLSYGVFNLSVTATNNLGCTSLWTQQVVNQTNPALGIQGPPNGSTTGCDSAGYWFKLTNYTSNTVGTNYLWDFGDGTSSVNWITPVTIDSIFHVFTKTSCGLTNNQFTVTIKAQNSCKTTSATIGGIQIFKRPKADFTTSESTACANKSISFTNTSTAAFNEDCSRTTLYSWDFGDPSSGSNTSTSVNATHAYTSSGTYRVMLIASGSCGSDTIIKQICITSSITPSFTIDNSTGCLPLTVTATNTTNVQNSCLPATYNWSVTYANAYCGTSSDWSFASNTNANSTNPAFLFKKAGKYTITLSVTNPCGTFTTSKTVDIKQAPSASLSVASPICAGATTSPIATVTNCGSNILTYLWNFSGGTPATSTVASPANISFAAGSQNITLGVTNECGTTTVSNALVVNPIPNVTVPSDQSFCAGTVSGSLNFSSNTGGTTFSWTNSNTAIGLASSGTGNISSFTATNTTSSPITATITVTPKLGSCNGTPVSFTITVNPIPAAPIVSTPLNYCQNATAIALTATSTSGNSLKWYTVASGGTGNTTAPVPTTNTVGSTTYYVSQYNITTLCESVRTALVVTIKATPSISLNSGSSGTTTSCGSSTGIIVLSGLASNTQYTVNYDKSGTPITATITSNASGLLSITGLPSGTYSNISVTIVGSNCPSNIVGPFTISDPNPPATPVANSVAALCSGNNFTLSVASPVSGTTYLWTGPSYSQTTTNGSVTITNASTVASGVYSVTATVAGCTSAAGTTTVTVNQTPAAPVVTSPITYCQGSTALALTAIVTSGNTLNWYGNNATGGTASSTAPTPTISTVGTVNYYVSQINTATGCESGRSLIAVTTNATPLAPTVTATVNYCQGSTASALTATATGSNTLKWYTAATGGTVIATPIPSTASLGTTTYYVSQITNLGCESPSAIINVVVNETPTAPTVTAVAYCQNATAQPLTATAIGNNTLKWYTVATGGTGNTTAPTPSTTNVGITNYYVSQTNTATGCESGRSLTAVTINTTPNAPLVTTPVTYCEGNTAIALTATATGSNNLNWYSTATGGTASTTAPTPTTTTAGTTNYYVSQTTPISFCESPRATVAVVIKPTPFIDSINKINPVSCASITGTIRIYGAFANDQFLVNYKKNGATANVTNIIAVNGIITIGNLSAGTYSDFSVTLNGCPSNTIGLVTLSDPNPPATPTINAANAVCSGKALTLNISSPDASLTYTWSGQGGISGTDSSITIPKTIMANNGTVSVTATKNSCTSLAGTIVIKIDSTPVAPSVTTPITICSGNTVNLTASTVSVGSGSINYAWTGPSGFTDNVQNPTIPNAQTNTSGTYVVTATNGNCTSAASNVVVTVNATPVITDTSSINPNKCATASGSFKFKTSEANKTFTVYYNDGSVKTKDVTSDANGFISIANLVAGTYSNISVKTQPEGCTSNVVGPFILTDPTPPTVPTITGDSVLCSGKNLQLNTPSVTDATYKWLSPNGTTIATTQNLQLAAITTGQSGLYKLTITVNNCTSGAGTKNVIIDSTPAIPSVSSNAPLCSGSSLLLKASTVSPGNIVYSWTGPNNFTNNAANPSIPIVNETASGIYKVIATAVTSNCISDTASIVVLVRPALTKAVISGLDSLFICGFAPPANASQQLIGSINASRSFEKGKWSIISQPVGGNGAFTYDSTAATNFAYAKSGLYSIAWTITNDINCPATRDTVVLSIIDKPSIADNLKATATSICVGNPVTIQVPLSAISGQIKYWQFKRPANAANWQDTLVTNPSITFNNVQDTFSVRLVVIATDQVHCSGDTAFKEILINVAPPSVPGVSSGEDTVCQNANSGSVILFGNIGLPVTWQLSTDGVNFSNIPNSASQNYQYINLSVTSWFRAAVKSGACDTVFSNATKITVFPPVKPALAGNNVELCGDSTLQLNGNVPGANEIGLWTFIAGSPTAILVDATNANTLLRNMQPNNNYQLLWTLSNGICPATSSSVTIKNYLPLTNTIDTSTVTVCNSALVVVTGATPIGGSQPYKYQWQAQKGNIWVDIVGANSISYNLIADTTVKLRRLVTALPCTNTSLEKTVYVQPPLANNTIAGAAETCINTSPGVLIGSLPTGGDGNYIYQWQILKGNTWTDINGANQKNYTVPTLVTNTSYRRLVTSALCSGNQGLYSSSFDIIVRPDAEAKWTITKDTACAPFAINNSIVTPTLIPTKNVNYSWYANGNSYGNNATINPGYTLTKAGDSIIIKMVANSLYGCKNDSLLHVFFTIPPVLTNFTVSDTAGCGPLKVTFTNTTPYLGFFTYQWNFGNNTASTQAQPASVTYVSNPNFGDTTYLISLAATSECESVIKIKTVTVASKPKSIFTPSKTTGCSPMTVSFTNLSKGIGVTYLWDFGDGNMLATLNKQSVSHIFSSGVQDTFVVKLIAMNHCGNDTSSYSIVVSPNKIRLDFAVNGNQKQVCKPATVNFINASSGATNFQWNFGDGNVLSTTKNLDTVSHTFLQAGNYTVTLFATNGCSDTTTTELIQVFNAPSANFNAVPTSVCLGDTIHFTNQTDTITGLLWNFKDGYTTTVINPVHAYKASGIYNVQLTAIRQYSSGLACKDSITKPITVLSSLQGQMKVSDSISSCVPFTTTFTNLSLPSAITIWQLGNGIVDTGNIITYTYTKVGSYTVNMVATNSGGCKYVASANIKVNGPEGTWQYDKGFICGATPVRYEVFATGTDSVRWNFGDGIAITTSDKIVYHNYVKSGIYLPTATLISSSLKGCSVTLKGTDTIKVDYVSAGFIASDNKQCGITTVKFTDTSRSYFPITSYSWNFGNGKTAITPTASQQYTTTNTWQTDLTVTSASGCSNSISKSLIVKVNNYPKVNIETLPLACTNKPTNYFASVTSNDSINLYSWQFSNGVNLNGSSVNNLYNTVGTYTAKILVSTIYGCADSTTLTHTLNPTPTVVASVDQLICRGKSVPLSVTGAATYSWVPLNSNLSCYNCNNPIAAPTTTTNYIVTGYNSVGCSNDDTVLITVAQPIKLTVSPNDTICIGQSSQLSVTGATSYVWSPSIGLNNTTIATPIAKPSLTTKYQVIGFDNHNCFQDTAYVVVAVGQYPTIQLAADQVLATGTLLPLNYTSTNGPLTSWKWTPSTNLSCSDCAVPVATIKKDICYTVVAANMYHCPATDTICIKVFCENTQVFIPNVFTPDNDGVNDVLMVRGTGIKAIKSFRIFNRWGQIVFERGNISPNNASQGWDGKINGIPASPDVYVYTCEVVCENDVTFTYKGNVAIIK